MTKYTFVGDIHGKIDVVDHVLEKEGKIIFVGDFMDSFDRSAIDHEDCLTKVLRAIDDGKAEAILGNHELSYLMVGHRCSGYSIERAEVMMRYADAVIDKFKPFIQLPQNWLITHAGMHPIVHANYIRSGLSMEEWEDDEHSAAHWIGRSRGGSSFVGGIYWCDFNMEFEPVEGINQIFGHTAGPGIRHRNTPNSANYCIDCLDYSQEFFELEF